ncbi:DUF3053 domain-containing protein [Achromobacter mucicolens]|uniref:DUF3053 domain-containing protein n=1 Tax=Achromobacter mucicolens TaxID=1389922 RepID=UPI0021D0CCDD|nr:DUF3053 domain-containing protein [Achromobacter mucicolens]MCU6615413.1 DUF3053 domain-containing protein [Achromobacter mucicolens]
MVWVRAWVTGMAVVSMLLAACVNKEPQERAAFIQLLQGRMNNVTLVPIGMLGKSEKEAIGGYDDAYEVMTDFQEALAKAAAPLREVLSVETIQSVEEIVARRGSLEAARKTLAGSAAQVQAARGKADKARADLALPADLAPVYDGVYDEAVTAPAGELIDAASRMDAIARDALAIADFVAANAADIQFEGGQTKVVKPTLQQELNQRLQALNAQSGGLEAARATLLQAASAGSAAP